MYSMTWLDSRSEGQAAARSGCRARDGLPVWVRCALRCFGLLPTRALLGLCHVTGRRAPPFSSELARMCGCP